MKRLIINKNKKRHDFFVDNVPLGSIIPFSGMITPPGYLECDGREISRIEYADLFDIIGTIYGEGNGASTFNVPDLRGRFLEGSDSVGVIKEAGLPNIKGQYTIAESLASAHSTFLCTGPYEKVKTISSNVYYLGYNSGASGSDIGFNASKANSIYSDDIETVQPPSITIRYIIKVFDANVNDDNYNLKSSFTIVYPNGGTKDNPANVASNSRYILDNPFPRYYINCLTEVKYNNKWGRVGYYFDSSNYRIGALASQYNDENIVLQVLEHGLFVSSYADGNPFNVQVGIINNLPCRIKVWKIGKIQ